MDRLISLASTSDGAAETHLFEAGMPPELPGAMPPQSLKRLDPAVRHRLVNKSAKSKAWRRMVVFGLTILLAGGSIEEMRQVLAINGMTPLEWVVLGFFSITFSWISLAFATGVFGTIEVIRRRFVPIKRITTPLKGRTAILVPSYNEDAARIFAGIEAMAMALYEAGEGHSFDWIVLADTTDPEAALLEEAALQICRERLQGRGRVYYRRRRQNVAKKAGNVHDFFTRWGRHYDQVVVFDADSTMTAETVIEMTRRMEADPDAGLIQTIPMLVNGTTIFARLQQFAGRVYGPVVGTGLAWWAQREGNFWGHNAVIRTKAFMEAAGLPDLPGKPPFGGHVMSHDFVEAALLRRAGWSVIVADDLGGSYEESPPSIIDMAVRDRRWCQGNLQHSKIIGAKGLHWANRLHMAVGIMSYLSSPLWLLLILSGLALSLQAHFIRPEYFTDKFSLFPSWPSMDPQKALALFAITMGVLFGPKLMGLVAFLMDGKARKKSGGFFGVLVGVVAEIILSGLVAPIMMLAQTSAVFQIVMGRDGGWKPQNRDDGSLPWRDLWMNHRYHMLFGLVMLGAAYAESLELVAWLAPALAGLLIAMPLSAFTGSLSVGRVFKRLGILAIPEEIDVPEIILQIRAVRPVYEGLLAEAPGAAEVLRDSRLRRAHLALVDPVKPRRRGQINMLDAVVTAKIQEAETVEEAVSFLDKKELSWALASPVLIDRIASLAVADDLISDSHEVVAVNRQTA